MKNENCKMNKECTPKSIFLTPKSSRQVGIGSKGNLKHSARASFNPPLGGQGGQKLQKTKKNIFRSRLNKGIQIGLSLIIIFLSGLPAASQNIKKDQTKDKKQIVLFDGTSTDAWRDTKTSGFPEKGWKTENGILTVLAKTEQFEGGHDIVTKELFSRFKLELEVRLSEGANSGVKYMVIDSYPGKKGQYLGLEYQLIDDDRHPDALLGVNGNRKMATLYDIFPAAENLKIHPPGKWNKVKIIVDGNHAEHWLNGRKAVDYNRDSVRFKEMVRLSKYNELKNFGEQEQGHILLQGHGNEVSFRKIRITVW